MSSDADEPALPHADRVAVIVGGSSGIGLGIARALARDGCRTILTGRDTEKSRQAADTVPGATSFSPCDVREQRTVTALFEHAAETFGRVDMVVISAGIGRSETATRFLPQPVSQLSESEWDTVMNTNLRGAFRVCREAVPLMLRQRSGQIVNVSSARGALRGQPFGAPYCASKMAVRILFHSLAAELKPLGIRAFSVLPDAVATDLIAGTNLTHRGATTPDEIGLFVAQLLALPADTVVEDAVFAPLRPPRKGAEREGTRRAEESNDAPT